jgi:hypothetical protein
VGWVTEVRGVGVGRLGTTSGLAEIRAGAPDKGITLFELNRGQKKIWKSAFSWAFQIFEMVGRVGFEPTTNWLKANCSTN